MEVVIIGQGRNTILEKKGGFNLVQFHSFEDMKSNFF